MKKKRRAHFRMAVRQPYNVHVVFSFIPKETKTINNQFLNKTYGSCNTPPIETGDANKMINFGAKMFISY